MRLKCFAALAALALTATSGLAQNGPGPQPTRIRAIVTSFNAPTLVVKSDDGQTVTVTVPGDLRIIANATLDDIKPGDFVGSAADQGPDGKLHAEEVHIFAEALRGTGEGHRPMAGAANRTMTNATVTAAEPSRTMTNATVAGVAGAAGSKTLKMQYKDGEQEIEVAPDVPIVRLIVGDTSLLKPGSTVAIRYVQKDGCNVATNLAAEKDGVKPR
jgi:hypothetical protein